MQRKPEKKRGVRVSPKQYCLRSRTKLEVSMHHLVHGHSDKTREEKELVEEVEEDDEVLHLLQNYLLKGLHRL